MDFGAWQKKRTDPVRLRRLALGYAAGAFVMTGTLGVVGATAAKAYGLDEETVVEAALVETAEDEPEVREEPVLKKQDNVKPKRLQQLVEPTRISGALIEKTPVASDNPYDTEDPYALLDDAERAPPTERPKVLEAPKVIEKPKPVLAPRAPSGPIRVTEEVTPPRAVVQTKPDYPADAKAAGIEGTVIVKFVVTEKGEVTEVQAVRGPPELFAVCEAAVRSWRFMPALKDGQPVAVHRQARFPFRINL